MNYIGKLYGKLNRRYFDTGKTSEDWDILENKINETEEIKSRFNEFGIQILHEEYDEIDDVFLIVRYNNYKESNLDMHPLYEYYGDNIRIVNHYKDIFTLKQN